MPPKRPLKNDKSEQRTRLNQSDIPAFTLDKALAVAKAIGDNYAYRPASPLDVASALGLVPTTGGFRMLTGASVAYGLTSGGYSAAEISITPLGMRIVRPISDEADVQRARKEAAILPKTVGDFLRKYDGAALPKDEIAKNVLHAMGVPLDRTTDALSMILETAVQTGLLRKINDKTFVDLKGTNSESSKSRDAPALDPSGDVADLGFLTSETQAMNSQLLPTEADKTMRSRNVFITHGKNRALIEPIEKLAKFGDLNPIVSVNTSTASLPVPDKIMEQMRSCGAAIILVENERVLSDADGNVQSVLNENVLIEIGAAMALFGNRFIIVAKDGVTLPSNLQGLMQLRYKGDTLDVNDTVNLLGAMADIKIRPFPK